MRAVVGVKRAVDANTIELAKPFMFADRVELEGLDEPEDEEAARYAARTLEGRDVEIEYDRWDAERGLLGSAYLWIDGELYQERVVREGFNRYTWDTGAEELLEVRADKLHHAEEDAKARGAGLWGSAIRAEACDAGEPEASRE